MVRIEFKKVAEGRIVLGMEVEDETPADVVMCALRGFVGVARRVLDKKIGRPLVCEADKSNFGGDAAGCGRHQGDAGRGGQRGGVYGSAARDECGRRKMKLEEYEQILRTGTPSDRARAIAAASDDKELSEEDFHQLTALIKGAVRPTARKMTPDEAKLWAEVSRVNTRLKQEMVAASFTVRALPGDLQEDAINILSKTVSGMLGDLSCLMAETGEP